MMNLTIGARVEAATHIVTYHEPGNSLTLYPRPYQVRAQRYDRGTLFTLSPLTVRFDHDRRLLEITPNQIRPVTPSPSERADI